MREKDIFPMIERHSAGADGPFLGTWGSLVRFQNALATKVRGSADVNGNPTRFQTRQRGNGDEAEGGMDCI